MHIGTCLKGLEEICCKIAGGRWLVAGGKQIVGRVGFSKLDRYLCFDKVYKLIDNFKFKDLDDLVDKIKLAGGNQKMMGENGFKIECSRIGEHSFNSVEVESAIAKKFGLDFKNKKIIFIDIVDDNCFYGELIYSDLCKRDYRVKLQAETINACLGFCALKLLGVKKNDVLLDLYCRDGVILIEGALIGCKCFGFMENIRNARINSKIAKVDLVLDESDFSKAKTRFKENSVYVCSYFPSISKRKSEKMVFRFYRSFFENSFACRKICLICRKKDILEFIGNWRLKKEVVVEKGDEKFYVFLLGK